MERTVATVTGATLGWVALGQSLAPVQLVGFAITLAAIAYGASLGLEPEPGGTSETQGGSSRSAEKDGSAHAIRISTDIGDHRRTTIMVRAIARCGRWERQAAVAGATPEQITPTRPPWRSGPGFGLLLLGPGS